MKANRFQMIQKARSLRDNVQELYRPKRSSLGYELLDYNVLSMIKIQVMVQARQCVTSR